MLHTFLFVLKAFWHFWNPKERKVWNWERLTLDICASRCNVSVVWSSQNVCQIHKRVNELGHFSWCEKHSFLLWERKEAKTQFTAVLPPSHTHTHKLEQAVCFYLEGVVSRFSLTVQRVRRLGNLVCRKNTLTHKREINWDTSWSSGTHTHCTAEEEAIYDFPLHFSLHITRTILRPWIIHLWFPFCYFTQDTDHKKV